MARDKMAILRPGSSCPRRRSPIKDAITHNELFEARGERRVTRGRRKGGLDVTSGSSESVGVVIESWPSTGPGCDLSMDVGSFDVERMTSYTVRSSCPRVQRVQVERGQAPAVHVKRIRISECSYINCWGPPNSTMTYSQCPTVHIEIIDVYIYM